MTTDAVNSNSTTEWVDEAYSRQLWGRLVRCADSIPPGARRSLLTVRRHANEVWKDRWRGRAWFAFIFVPAGNTALDYIGVRYDRDGRFQSEMRFMRISQHAGQRLFERLRTNSVEDVLDTVRASIVTFSDRNALTPTEFQGVEKRLVLAHGTLHVVADSGLWVAKTFIPAKPE